LSFSKIKPNAVSFSGTEMVINVNKSSAPLVYLLPEVNLVKSFKVVGKIKGKKTLENSLFDEDSILRFGLVGVGSQRLTMVQKLFAADWVKKLFSLVPPNSGLDKVYFFNTTNRSELIGKSRKYPSSDLLFENFVTLVNAEGDFEMNVIVDPPVKTAALWLSLNGDLANSTFEVTLKEIVLK
jgi:hypothetical protein